MTFWFLLTLGLIAAIYLALWVHHVFEGEWLPDDILREWRLTRRSLTALDARWAQAKDRSDITITLTTTPSRISLLDTTLKSLLDQSVLPAKIILNIPDFSQREQVTYTIPAHLTALKSVQINTCDDLGPGTKLIPVLRHVSDDAALLVLDDDRIYPNWLIERYQAAAAQQPDAALTMGGWVVPENLTDEFTTLRSSWFMLPPAPIRAPRLKQPREIDVMLGVFSYLVRPRFFDIAEMEALTEGPPELRYVDDVRTSALCHAAKYVIPARSLSFVPRKQRDALQSTRLGLMNRGGSGKDTGSRHNTIGIRHYANRWRVGGPKS